MTPDAPVIPCLKCGGSGIAIDLQATTKPASGVLLPLCESCRGGGQLLPTGAEHPFRAAWIVGSRFIVRMEVEKRKGGFVELDLDWSPRLPPEKGPGKLRPSEQKDYERGRDDALRQHMAQMGGGDFSVVSAKARH